MGIPGITQRNKIFCHREKRRIKTMYDFTTIKSLTWIIAIGIGIALFFTGNFNFIGYPLIAYFSINLIIYMYERKKKRTNELKTNPECKQEPE
jgi:hypothetical protein